MVSISLVFFAYSYPLCLNPTQLPESTSKASMCVCIYVYVTKP